MARSTYDSVKKKKQRDVVQEERGGRMKWMDNAKSLKFTRGCTERATSDGRGGGMRDSVRSERAAVGRGEERSNQGRGGGSSNNGEGGSCSPGRRVGPTHLTMQDVLSIYHNLLALGERWGL